jgi:hypothetical protein
MLSRKPAVKYVIRQKEADLHPQPNISFQVYDQDSSAPLPSSATSRLFGNLFGISFDNIIYTAENRETKEHVRAISVAEYTSFLVKTQIIRRTSMGNRMLLKY